MQYVDFFLSSCLYSFQRVFSVSCPGEGRNGYSTQVEKLSSNNKERSFIIFYYYCFIFIISNIV